MMKIFKEFPKSFWIANTMELFERWAWYGIFIILPIYLTGSKDSGALGFSQEEKSYMMAPVSALLYILPLFTGAIADKVGYKKVLILSYSILGLGYYFLGQTSNYFLLYLTFIFVAIGGAFFKPIVSATVSKTTNKSNASIGFGIFYMMVNLGALLGQFFAAKFKESGYHYAFTFSVIAIIVNMLLVILFFKEPEKEKNSEKLSDIFMATIRNIAEVLKDWRYFIFLLIIVGFWTMYNQLFLSLTVFIDQWVNTASLYQFLHNISPSLAEAVGTKQNTIEAEMMTTIDALYIVILQILVSTAVMKWKPINTIIVGFIIAAIGIGLTFATQNPFFVLVALLVFGIGEMSSSPKITEYIGSIAPKDKKALYMGTSFLPVSGGFLLAGVISGSVYQAWSDKYELVQREITKHNFSIPTVSENFTKNDLFNALAEKMHYSSSELTRYLWETYNPSKIWVLIAGIGVGTAILMFIYNRFIVKN